MAHTGTGLGDNQRMYLTLAFAVFNSVSASIFALDPVIVPPGVPIILTIIGNAIIVVMVQLGIRDSTSARVAKEVDASIDNARDTSESR